MFSLRQATQIAANQANSQHSAGPTIEEGKATSCLNNFRWGFCGAFTVLPSEDQEEYDGLLLGLRAEHQPLTVTETIVVEKMARITGSVSVPYGSMPGRPDRQKPPGPGAKSRLIGSNSARMSVPTPELHLLKFPEPKTLIEIGKPKGAATARERFATLTSCCGKPLK